MCEWGGGRRRYGRECQPKTRTPHKDVGNYMDTEGKKDAVHLSFLVVLTGQLNQTME